MGADRDELTGIVADLNELIAARPKGSARGYGGADKVRTLRFGGHKSSFRGRGMEFDEVRTYQPGDDVRTIDWRVTARTGKAHTKLFQEERERPVLVVLDLRPSMLFGTRVCFKSVLAARACAFVSWVALEGGDRVGGLVLTPDGLSAFAPRRSRNEVLGLMKAMAEGTRHALSPTHARNGPPLADALARARHASRPGTLVFVASDFSDFDAAAEQEMGRLATHCEVANLFVQDALEEAAPPPGAYRLSDGKSVAILDLEGRAAPAAYVRLFAERRARIEAFSRKRGLAFRVLRTGDDPADLLSPARLQPGRKGPR